MLQLNRLMVKLNLVFIFFKAFYFKVETEINTLQHLSELSSDTLYFNINLTDVAR